MWRTPLPLIAGANDYIRTFQADEWIGDLFTYLGSPSLPLRVEITADNCDLGGIYISSNFAPGSTFDLIGVNGGRFIGAGGNGGNGGNDNGASATSGTNGTDGGHAVASEGFTVNIDIDDGYLLGGGGGGGGASGADRGATADPGGGGGGGAGFTGQGGFGGDAGTGTGSPPASDGQDGDALGPGSGGAGGGTTNPIPDGGDGGGYGHAGYQGYHDGGLYNARRAGVPGSAGNAFAPISGAANVVFSGSQTEAQLRTSNRIKGETEGFIVLHKTVTAFGSSMASFTLGWTWSTNGRITRVNSLSGNSEYNNYWWRDTFNGTTQANLDNTQYEIVQDSATEASGLGWDINFLAQDTYYVLSQIRNVSMTDSAFRFAGQLFRIRRVGETGDLAAGYYQADMEDGS